MNPYYGLTFIDFLLLFLHRLSALITGQITFKELATDEIQVFVIGGVALSSALIGSFLVLKKMTMLANSLSHTILIGIVLAYFFTPMQGSALPIKTMLLSCLLVGVLTTFLTEFLSTTAHLQEDASVGLVFTSLFALGVILVTLLTRNSHIGLEAVMGNADALHMDDLYLVGTILGINILIFTVFYRGFKITTFDPNLAKALGYSTLFFNYLLMTQVSATTISAFRAVGVLLVLAFITGPVLIARLMTHNLKILLILAMTIGFTASLFGVALTRHILTLYGRAFSTAGVVVCLIGILYGLALLVTYLKLLSRQNKEGIENTTS